MKKYVVLLFALVFLASPAMGDVSQQEATSICNPYSIEGETLNIIGPISCEGDYWVCEFIYYGNKQNVAVAIAKGDGGVLSPASSLLRNLISAKYATEGGSSQIFGTFLNDANFAIQLEGMGATLDNYEKGLKSLSDDGFIERSDYIDVRDRVSGLKEISSGLAGDLIDLNNLSQQFWDSPDCGELIDYLNRFNNSLDLTENFSAQWNAFIDEYNIVANSVEVYVASINPSDARILQNSIPPIRSGLEDYYEDEELFVDTVIDNLETRFERNEAKEYLDGVAEIVKETKNPEAVDRYNRAKEAFLEGDYKESTRLGREAIALAGEEPPPINGVKPPEAQPDYTIYFIMVGILLVAILIVTLRQKREPKERKEKKEKVKKGSWAWTKKKESSMEKKASKGLL